MTINKKWIPEGMTTDDELISVKNEVYEVLTSDKNNFKELLSLSSKVVWIGDSITEQGRTGIGNGVGFTSFIEEAFPHASYVNEGVGGYTTNNIISNISTYKAHNPDLFVVAVGINDIRYNDSRGATSKSSYISNMTTIIDELKSTGASVVVLSIWPTFWKDQFSALHRKETDERIIFYNRALAYLAKEKNILFINASELIRRHINLGNVDELIPDGVHPSLTGVKAKNLYAEAVLNEEIPEGKFSTYQKPVGKHFFKLIIPYHDQGSVGGYVGIKNIGVASSEYYGTSANLSYGMSKLFGDYDSSFGGYYNKAHDWPLIITFSTSTFPDSIPVECFNSAGGPRQIRVYDLFYSSNPDSLLDLNHSSWELLSTEKSNAALSVNVMSLKRKNIYYSLIVDSLANEQTQVKMKQIGDKLPIRVWLQNITSSSLLRIPTISTTGVSQESDALTGLAPNFVYTWESSEELDNVILESFNGSLGKWRIRKSHSPLSINNPIHSSWEELVRGYGDGIAWLNKDKSIHPRQGFRLVEHWEATTAAGVLGWGLFTNAGLLGGNASSGGLSRFGIVRLDTSINSNSAPTLSRGSYVIGGARHTLETSINMGLSSATEEFIVRIGYHNSTNSTLPTNGIYFEYDRTKSTYWRVITVQGGVATETTTSLAVAGGWKELRIEISADGLSSKFYIDNNLIGENTTNIPSGTSQIVSPVLQIIKTAGTSPRILYCDWVLIEAIIS